MEINLLSEIVRDYLQKLCIDGNIAKTKINQLLIKKKLHEYEIATRIILAERKKLTQGCFHLAIRADATY